MKIYTDGYVFFGEDMCEYFEDCWEIEDLPEPKGICGREYASCTLDEVSIREIKDKDCRDIDWEEENDSIVLPVKNIVAYSQTNSRKPHNAPIAGRRY